MFTHNYFNSMGKPILTIARFGHQKLRYQKNMKKIGLILLGFSVHIYFAQANRFIYQVTMKPDSENPGDVRSENAYLDVNAQKSIFYSEKSMKRDSILSRARETGNFNFDRSQMQSLRSNIDFIIEKDYKSGVKTFKSRIARDQYAYEEDRTIDWKVLPETLKIGDYKTQKAETEFAGRTWYAWFTTDVPIQDGPYKFAGLPGLIVKVEDAKGDYSFDLKEAKKIAEIQNPDSRGSVIKVKRKDYEKQNEAFRRDPVSFFTAQMSSGRSGPGREMRGGGGGMRTPNPNMRKQMEERVKEEIRKSSNPIELK